MQYKNVKLPPGLHQPLKVLAAEQSITLQALVVRILTAHLQALGGKVAQVGRLSELTGAGLKRVVGHGR
jgi:hypothetical protein